MVLKEKEIMLDFLDKLQEWGWSYLDNLQYGRGEKTHTAIYESKLFPQIKKINPYLADNAIMKGIEELFSSKDNQEAFNYLRNGIIINIQGENKKVKFIDFDNPQQNKFSYFPQLRIRTKHNNYLEPDLILFINYLPVVVFEFKDQVRAGRKWKEEAFRQIKDYEKDLSTLFLLNTFNVLSNGYDFLVGTITSEIFHYTPWKSEKNNLFASKIILDIIQNYLVFNSEKVKKITRYHQYDCVKETLQVMEKSSLKGGVNAHTTGSGKSDTMAFLANQLRHKHSDCTIIVITDRNELDRQIYERFREYEGTFFTLGDLVVIEEISKLKSYLEKPNQGKIIFALVQKFQDLVDLKEKKIIFDNPAGVFVFIDEAHRSQNLIADTETKKVSWAWEMRRVFPQAFFLGFTATPIEGKTYEEIGPPIHTYSANQAIQNEIIVNIIYEKAYEFLPEIHWDEEKFTTIFPEKEGTFIDKRKSLKSRKDLFFENPQRITTMCDFFKKDYENFSRQHYLKGKPKVMYMAYNIEAAHKLFKELQKDPHYQNKACLIVSKQHHYQSSELINAIGKEKENIRKFKDPQSDLNIVIVVDKLTTGFNMENLERIYLDQQIAAPHNFFQKISRVNRKYSDKEQGFVVDLVGNKETYQKVLIEYFDDKNSGESDNGKIENLWNFFTGFHSRKELYRLLFNHRQINQKPFFDKALNYCAKKTEEERKEFFSETKSLRLTLSSQWYITGKEEVEKEKNLEFANWCFRLGCYFNFDFPDEPTVGDDEKNRTAEAKEVEEASWEAIEIAKIDFNNFDFSQIRKQMMSIDPEKYPDIHRRVLEGKIKRNLDRRENWWFSVKEWEDKFQILLKKYNENKINIHDLNTQLTELNKELEKENQKVNQKLEKDIHYPLRKKLIEKLPLSKRENNNFVSELIESFLKLNKDIPDWSLREDERRKARKNVDEKTKKYFKEKMPQKERGELISLLESYFLSEYYSSQKK
ncbi:MAG: type I restriction endonuclease subunit R [Candidatus Moeniiplasma glomeromycotorum]|nr:type I restriction endonuclease subunit R [Candidatus Moeniiplasma glomeromycotorum]MCE8162318.1 type I restriction endonuclease subunit R [Candidatus Moeniiplasma glomeromycotorum]MCE8166242.1 type I restriction endonuclease subunit R [Candidatus Moeniiplasma glomeromycotorum]MCE8166724.1 type I restriction endonuclease subunit R [Candidatus Moeniiplasma glomeromycotorum]